MIGRWLKPLGILAGVLVLLTVVLILVLPLLLSGEGVRNLVVEKVAEATGAQVSLGASSVKVLPRLAVRLENGSLAGTGQALRERQGGEFNLVDYEAEIRSVEVRVALWPLLRKRIEVEGVEVDVARLALTLPEDRIVVEDGLLTVSALELGVPEAAPPAGAAPVPPGLLIPEDLSCRAGLTVARLTAREALYTDVSVSADLDGRLLTAEPIVASRDGGAITGSAEIDWERDPWGELVFDFDTDGVPAGSLLAPFAPDLARKLDTILIGEGSGRCNLKDAETVLATLDLTGRAGAAEGVLHAGDWLKEIKPYLGERQDLVDVHFRELVHGFRIEKGRYNVTELFIDGLETEWRGGGWVGLDGTIDLNLGTRLPAGFTPDLGQWSFVADALRDEEGRVNLQMRVSGQSKRPAVTVDLSQLKSAAQDNAGEVLKEGIGGLLDKWKNR